MTRFAGLMMAAVMIAGIPRAAAEDVYLEPAAFLRDTFGGAVPEPAVVWITKSLKGDVAAILGHRAPSRRLRYWRQGDRTAWILEEIGKVEPITTGYVVEAGRIEAVRVLVYRESRGWEVRHPFFTDQFRGVALNSDLGLDSSIDGISGATLSVRALVRLARLALYLHGHVTETGNS